MARNGIEAQREDAVDEEVVDVAIGKEGHEVVLFRENAGWNDRVELASAEVEGDQANTFTSQVNGFACRSRGRGFRYWWVELE